MAKRAKSFTTLSDASGVVYAQAELTQAATDRLIKEYKRAGIELFASGSVNQLLEQVDILNAFLDERAAARALRESGRLVVIGC
jgi:hypothetical protein